MGIFNSLILLGLVFSAQTSYSADVLLSRIYGDSFGCARKFDANGRKVKDPRSGNDVCLDWERIEFYAITNTKNEITRFRMDTRYVVPRNNPKREDVETLKQSVYINALSSTDGFQVRADDVVIPAFKEARGYMKNEQQVLFQLNSIKSGSSTLEKISPTAGGLLRLAIVKDVDQSGLKVVPNSWTYVYFQVKKNSGGIWMIELWDPTASSGPGKPKGAYVNGSSLFMVSTKKDFGWPVGVQISGISKVLNKIP